eukprot:gnl/TRDRNA2_/TRDRNA2_90762_c0_seq2.p1 gnl/TRDRNA2_/TRDRNA2_90762_c0~~gnl/TRDRNA2_/TRDRNA2_90762_c0_seq2.p1  ORF type:complete len:311 (+),score=42.97 gnl/TRDRNA2_/TRDRNA2_90762_c0_seq2:65-934(+)
MSDKLCTGGRDGKLLLWRGEQSPHNDGGVGLAQDNEVGFQAGVTALFFHPESKWLFCGLDDGLIKAYRQQPLAETQLQGHTATVRAFLVHEAILLSGSEDATIRAWKYDDASASFQCAATISSPLGRVFAMHIEMPTSLWLGTLRGICCVNLQTLQPVGEIVCDAHVVGLVRYQDCIIAGLANGVIKIFDGTGSEKFSHGPVGEHTTNTTIATMTHPHANKVLLLCGQEFGYVTAYDLPDFRPRGTFNTGYDGEVQSIVDMQAGGLFVTCGASGDVVIWRWERNGGMAM